MLFAVAAASAPQQDSAPKQTTNSAPAVASTSTAANPRVNRLLQLEERITRALKGLSSGNSIEPVAPRPPTPVVRHAPPVRKQDREDALRRDDWMLMTPEDFAEHEASLQTRKMLREGGIIEGDRLSPEDRMLRDLANPSFGTRGLVDSLNERDLQPESRSSSKGSTPAEIAVSEENLRDMIDQTRSSGLSEFGSKERSFLDLFKTPESEARDFESSRKEASFVDEYRKLVSPATSVQPDLASSALNAAATDPVRAPLTAPGLDSGFTRSRDSLLGPQFGNINPVLTPRSPQDTTEQVLNQWNKYYTPPAPEPPKSSVPEKPTFEAPRRRF